jgi:hypothetical protein
MRRELATLRQWDELLALQKEGAGLEEEVILRKTETSTDKVFKTVSGSVASHRRTRHTLEDI